MSVATVVSFGVMVTTLEVVVFLALTIGISLLSTLRIVVLNLFLNFR